MSIVRGSIQLVLAISMMLNITVSFADFDNSTEMGTYADPGYNNDRFDDYPYYRHTYDRPSDSIYNSYETTPWSPILYGKLRRDAVVLVDSRKNLYMPCRADYDVHILYGKSDGKHCYVQYRGEVHARPFFEVWTND